MNPIIEGLLNSFRETNELAELAPSDVFELFAASLVFGEELTSQVELTDLLLDKHAVGIDIAALTINGQLAWDMDDVDDICESAGQLDVSVHSIQAKRTEHVDSSAILTLADATKNLLHNQGLDASPKFAGIAQALHHIFSDYAQKLKGPPSVRMYFVTAAPAKAATDSTVKQRLTAAQRTIEDIAFVGDVTIECVGADDLHGLHVRQVHGNEVNVHIPKHVQLPAMPGVQQAFVGLVSVAELLKMVSSPDGSLDERVFFDNVRGFQGDANPVNRRIVETLASEARSLLPVLNNGVTVVAQSYTPKPADHFLIEDYQIVNGCQTSHCAYLAREELGQKASEVFVPLRLVITADEDVATQIIRATNSQTEVKDSDLVALSDFQKRLEDFYRMDSADIGLVYERRAGQFYGVSVTKTRLVTIADQLKAVAAVWLRLPHDASRFPRKLYAIVGDEIFKDEHRPLPYVVSAYAAYRLESAFRAGLDASFKVARYHLLLTVALQVLHEKPAPLDSPKSDAQATTLLNELRKPSHVELFQSASEAIRSVAGGTIPTRDRLKRPAFTSELIASFFRETPAGVADPS